ncbi:OmpA family protein [Bacteroidales bacterium OttesenSCG-928-B11]|nr:OmpA family protein [Bacteroidales bacterium OttesenSCG-928-B11]MDL2326358.1 OmpA family protein [Bacteroidales bacterium OttesenSCG-928-A14]
MKIKLLIPFILLLLSFNLTAQNTPSKKVLDLVNKAKTCINQHEFDKAEKYLEKIFNIDDTYAEAYLLQGDIYNVTLKSGKAADCYNKAISLMKNPKPLLYFIAASEELKVGRYESAQKNLQTYLDKVSKPDPQIAKEVKRGLENCEFGIWALQNPVDFKLINMGPSVNSEHDEYLVTITADEMELIFTVRRPRDEKTACAFCLTEEDFYYCVKENGEWQPRQPMAYPINSNYNEGAESISPDGKYFFYTLCDADQGYGSCDLYWSRRIGNRWSRPRNLGEPVNTSLWESQPSMAPDGRTIYFSSNRSGGYGGFDIWKCMMIEEGVFSEPVNLGPTINTEYDETAPFIHADGRTLYFVSDGLPGMGGKDIYYSFLKPDNSWEKPVNLGYPVNTPTDELNIFINASGTVAYIATDIEGGYGGMDLYSFELDEKFRPTPVTYMKGVIRDAETKEPLEASVELVDLATSQVVTSTTSDPATGEYLACIITGTNVLMNVSHPDYPFYSENFQLEKSYTNLEPYFKNISLQKAEVGSTFILRNIFFEFNKSDLRKESGVELDNLADYLTKNPTLHIEIGGHTDNQGGDEYNLKLSLERAKSVYNYLINKGIPESRLSYKGYGKNSPIATNDTEEGRAINRRTEFRIIKN